MQTNHSSIISLVPAVFACVAFICGLSGGIWCKFLKFTSETAVGDDVTVEFGIWYYQWWSIVDTAVQGPVMYQSCHEYPDYVSIDSKWKSARAFSVMALIIGGIVLFMNLLAGCMFPAKKVYRLGAVSYLFCCLFQGLSLLLLDSNACNNNAMVDELEKSFSNLEFPDTCSMGSGAKCTIAATVFWFVAGASAMKVNPPELDAYSQHVLDSERKNNVVTEPLL